MAHIHFKFKSSKRQDSVTFDGLSMSVADLKKAITEKMRSASTGSGKNEFDLEITNAQTKQVYYDMEEMIPKNSSVIVARMPIMTASSKLKIEQDRNSSSPKGHHDQLQDKEMSLAQLTQTPDLLNAKASEGDKIKAMMAQSTSDYDVSNYQRTRPVGPPPSYYKCYRCNQSGHYINNCPYKPDPGETQYKRSTGIPQSHLVTADSTTKGAYVTSTGQYVVPAVDAQAYKETKKTIVSKEEERFVPRELTCSMCKDLLTDAVVTPCCGDSFCDECMRSALLESDDHECPNCHASECSPDNLVPNKFLRTAVVNFLNDTGYTSVKKKRQPVSVAQPPVQQRPPTHPMQVKPPPVQPVVQNPPHAPPVVAQAPPVVAQTMPMAPQPGTTVMVPQPASVAPGNGIPQSQVGLPVSAAHQMAHQQVNAIPSSIPPGQYATQQYAPRPMVGGPQMNGMPVPPQVHPAYRMSHPMGDPRGAAPPHVHPPGAFPRHPGYPSRPPGPMMRPPHIPPGVRPPPGMQPGMPPQMLGMPPNGPPNLIPVVGGPPMSKEEFYMEKSRLLQKKLEAEKKKKPVDPMDDFARELLEYKSQQKKRLRSRSRSRSMTPRSRSWTRSPSRSRSKRPRSRTKSRSKSRSRTPKASKPRSRTRSRSRSPVRRRPPSRSPPARKRSRSRSPPPYRRSPGPYRPRSRSPYGGRRSRSPFYREYPPGDRYRSPPPPFYPRPHEFEDPRYRGPPPPAPRMDDFYRYEEPRFDPRYPQDEYYRDYYPRYPPHGRSRSPPPFPPPGPPEGWLRGRSPQPPPGTSPSRRRSREREPRSPGRERRSPGGGAVNKDRDSRRRSRSKERKSKDEERKKRSRSKDRASSEKSKREKTKFDSRSKENGPEKKSNTGSTKAEEPKKVRDKSSTSRSSSTSKKLSSSNENGKEKSAEVKKPEVESSADKKKKRKEKTDKSVEPSKKKVKTEEGEAKKKSKTKVKKKKTSASADSKTTDSEAEKKEKHKKKKVEAPITEAAPVVKAEATSSIDEGEKPGEGQLSQIEPREVKIKMEETSSSEIIDEFSTAAEPDFELLEPDADALLITAPEMSKWEREESGSDTNLTGSPKTKSAVELKRSLPKSVIESAEKVFAAKAPKAAVIPSVASAVHVHKPARRVYVEETGRKSEPSPERKVSSTVGTVGSTFQVTIKAPVTASSKTAPSEQSIGKVDLRHKLRINREKDKYKALETKVRADKERREKLESKSDTALTDRHSKSSHELKHSKSDTSVKRETDDVKKPSSRVLDRKESVIDESKFEPDYEDNESGNSEKESGSEDSDDEKASQTSSASSSDSEKKKKKKTSKHKKHKHHKKHKKHKKKHKKHKEKEEKREEKRK